MRVLIVPLAGFAIVAVDLFPAGTATLVHAIAALVLLAAVIAAVSALATGVALLGLRHRMERLLVTRSKPESTDG